MRKTKVLILLPFVFANNLFSQKKAEISAGISVPELLNLKIKYGNNFQLCGSIGYLPYISFWAYSADFYYHLPSKSNKDKFRKWFLNTGLSYFPPSESNSSSSQKTILMYTRVGRSFFFLKESNLTGLDFDLGIMFQIWTNEKYSYGAISMGSPEIKNPSIIGPAASISYFFKFLD